jgi:hypothetical protein
MGPDLRTQYPMTAKFHFIYFYEQHLLFNNTIGIICQYFLNLLAQKDINLNEARAQKEHTIYTQH